MTQLMTAPIMPTPEPVTRPDARPVGLQVAMAARATSNPAWCDVCSPSDDPQEQGMPTQVVALGWDHDPDAPANDVREYAVLACGHAQWVD